MRVRRASATSRSRWCDVDRSFATGIPTAAQIGNLSLYNLPPPPKSYRYSLSMSTDGNESTLTEEGGYLLGGVASKFLMHPYDTVVDTVDLSVSSPFSIDVGYPYFFAIFGLFIYDPFDGIIKALDSVTSQINIASYDKSTFSANLQPLGGPYGLSGRLTVVDYRPGVSELATHPPAPDWAVAARVHATIHFLTGNVL